MLGHIGGRSAHKGATLLEVVLAEGDFSNLEVFMIDDHITDGSVHDHMWGSTPARLIGHVPAGSINEVYQRIDVLVATSTWPESFGLVAREAQYYGKWVIASNLGAMTLDLIPDVNGSVVDARTKHDLRRLLATMNGDVPRYKAAVHQERMRTSDDQGSDLVKLYLEVLEKA